MGSKFERPTRQDRFAILAASSPTSGVLRTDDFHISTTVTPLFDLRLWEESLIITKQTVYETGSLRAI
jgi:hypothetical protein